MRERRTRAATGAAGTGAATGAAGTGAATGAATGPAGTGAATGAAADFFSRPNAFANHGLERIIPESYA